MNRQLSLCDRVLKEKNELTTKLSQLSEEIKNADKKFLSKAEEL